MPPGFSLPAAARIPPIGVESCTSVLTYPSHVHHTLCLSCSPCFAQLFGKGDSWADTLDKEVAKRNTLLLVALSPVAPREPTANSSSSAGWDGDAYEPQAEEQLQQQQLQQDKHGELQQVGYV